MGGKGSATRMTGCKMRRRSSTAKETVMDVAVKRSVKPQASATGSEGRKSKREALVGKGNTLLDNRSAQ